MRDQVLALLRKHLPGRALRISGQSQILTTCPFHKGGQERTPSFSVNVEKALYHCFTCHEAGTLRMLLSKLNVPKQMINLELGSIQPHLDRNVSLRKLKKNSTFLQKDPFVGSYVLPDAILGAYDKTPQKLLDDGFDPNLLRKMEVGYDSYNSRITYPLRDFYGNLVGISGGATKPTQHPKYKVYQGGRGDTPGDFGKDFDNLYPSFSCENHEVLWNYHRVYPEVMASEADATVYVVEGFKACLWMIQCGYPRTVALMGSYISDTQQRLLHRLGCYVTLFLDNDAAGRRATLVVGEKLWMPLHSKVRVVPYPEEDVEASIANPNQSSQPDDYQPEAIHQMTRTPMSYIQYFNKTRKNPQWR